MKSRLVDAMLGCTLCLVLLFFQSFSVEAAIENPSQLTLEEFNAKRQRFYQKRDQLIAENERLNNQTEIEKHGKQNASDKNNSPGRLGVFAKIGEFFGILATLGAVLSYFSYWLRMRKRLQVNNKEDSPSPSIKLASLGLAALGIVLNAATFSQAQNITPATSEQMAFAEKVDEIDKIIHLGDLDKAIRFLEKRQHSKFHLSANFSFHDPLTEPKLTVTTDSSEYYYLLAALYHAKSNETQTVYNLDKLTTTNLQPLQDNQRMRFILFQTMKFYQEKGRIEQAIFVSNSLLKLLNDPKSIDQLLTWLIDNSLITPSINALEILGKMVLNNEQYDKAFQTGKNLTKKLVDTGQFDQASLAAEKTLTLANNYEKLKEYVVFCFTNQLERSATQAVEQAVKRVTNINQLLDLIEVLYAKNNRKMGADLLAKIVDKAGNGDQLTTIALFSIEKDEIPLAIQALQLIFNHFTAAGNSTSIPAPNLIYEKEQIPADERIKLLSLMGVCYQKENKMALAEAYYKKSVELEMEDFIANGGLQRQININNMFFLIRNYADTNNMEMIRLLDPVYTFLEDQYILQLQGVNEKLKIELAEFGKPTGKPAHITDTLFAKIRRIFLALTLSTLQVALFSLIALFLIFYPWIASRYFLTITYKKGEPRVTR